MMSLDREIAIVEAILFLESEPVEARKIARISGLSKEVVMEALLQLQDKLGKPDSGLELSEAAGGYSLVPRKELWEHLKENYGRKSDDKLSKAAMETLSIIAYSQPLTRAEIESIRGVASAPMIKLLMDKGFIKEVGKKDAPGKPSQFGTTREFLQMFGLSSIADLPKLDDTEREKFELES